MVSRASLALILLMLFSTFIGLLYGEYQPPRLLSEPLLVLPADWQIEYDSMETLILVSVGSDGKAQLIRIMDGKSELKEMIINQLSTYQFSPALDNSSPQASEMTIKIKLIKVKPEKQTESPVITDETKIIDWIAENRAKTRINAEIIKNSLDCPYAWELNLYRSEYHLTGLINSDVKIIKRGIQVPATIYNPIHYIQYFNQFYENEIKLNSLEFGNVNYQFSAPMSELQTGLGDYEFKVAKGALYKNNMFNVKNMYFAGKVLFASGLWSDKISDNTSSSLQLEVPIENFILGLEYENYSQNTPSSYLPLGLQSSTIFNIDNRFNQIFMYLNNPYLNCAVMSFNDLSKASVFIKDIKTDGFVFGISKKLDLHNQSIKMYYQRNEISRNYQLPMYSSTNLFYDDRADLCYDVAYNKFKFNSETELLDWKRVNLDANILYTNNTWGMGVLTTFNYSDHNRLDQIPTIYNSTTTTIETPSLSTPWKIAPYFKKSWQDKVSLLTEFGLKHIVQYHPQYNIASVMKFDKTLLYAGVGVDCIYPLGVLEIKSQDRFQLQQKDLSLMDNPQWQFSSSGELKWKMHYDNSIYCGYKVIGHADYLAAAFPDVKIIYSSVTDLYFGLEISKMFDLIVSYKNIFDSMIYGVYPQPPTLQATLHWYFIN